MSATRTQHYAIYLSHFDYKIRTKKSKENAKADALTRLPSQEIDNRWEEVDLIERNAIENLPVTAANLNEASRVDKEVAKLIQCLKYGQECEPKERFGITQTEFTLQNGCLLRGIRVYIARPFCEKVLAELHTAHFGMSKMKTLARAYCWWGGLDKDIETLVSDRVQCQEIRADPKKVHCWMQPSKAFERVHIDYAGPFLGKNLLVLVDAYSKWPEVHVVTNINAETTIQKGKEIFARFSVPNTL
ncbi:uncharacterized protein K02A2.6-like, partial [Rhagoletis pomonella]|uniref:uncharacterized protein K02A2.6-like n=1 Tax=Rhagoletis pomonella TaxID=28610 RepID=UPI0017821DF4